MKQSPQFKALLIISCMIISFCASAQDLDVQLTVSDYNGYNVSCFGGQDGTIHVDVSGGTSPYLIYCDGSSVTEDITDLPAGYHHIIVYDSDYHGVHIGDVETSLTEPEQLQLNASLNVYGNGYNISCYNCGNGIMTINATGGVPPYHYL